MKQFRKIFFALFFLIFFNPLHATGKGAIIFTVDGLDIFQTILNFKNPKSSPNYLQRAIKNMNFNNPNVEIVSYQWSGDAKKTDLYLKELRKVMRKYYEKAQRLNKKFIVVSHSWGTFLSYAALTLESKSSNPIKCDLYITLSSPLGTYYAHDPPLYLNEVLINGFVNQWLYGLKISSCRNCFPIVNKWVNFWAWGDLISGPLNYLDNRIIDINVDPNSVSVGKDARDDIHTTIKWHLFTTLEPNGENESLIKKVRSLICSAINCTNSSNSTSPSFAFLLDSSGSMEKNDPNNMRIAAMNMIADQLSGNENIFIIDFDERAKWINSSNWHNVDKYLLKEEIKTIDSDGKTDIGAAIGLLKNILIEKNISTNIGVILLTDGLGDYNEQANWFSSQGIPINTISLIGNENSQLLNTIASETGGEYLKANSPQDITSFFNLLLNNIQSNSTLAVFKSHIMPGEVLKNGLIVDYTRYLWVTLVWRGSNIGLKLIDPNNNTYSHSNNNGNWQIGRNYKIFKIENPTPGKWKVEFTGIDVPPEGEDFTFTASSDATKNVNLITKDDNNGLVTFELNTPDLSSNNVTANVTVTGPNNQTADISNTFSGNKLIFYPDKGAGNYVFNFDIHSSNFQRHFTKTVFVGSNKFLDLSKITDVIGNYAECNLGYLIGNRVGITCEIFKKENPSKPIAKGYVTNVTSNNCTIELQIFYTNDMPRKGDIVKLDFAQWSNDK